MNPEPILSVAPASGGWEVRTPRRALWVPAVTMEAWLRRAGLTMQQIKATGCVLQLTSSGDASGIGWPSSAPE